MKKFDLHTHTHYSDGTLSPEELCQAATNIGLSGISITDHDTVDAYYNLPKTDLLIGVGIEFSCFWKEESVHILGYDFDYEHSAIKSLCQKHIDRRRNRNLAILKNLNQLGYKIDEQELYSRFTGRTVGRPHIAQLMVDKNIVGSVEEAFKVYLADGKKAYAKGELIPVESTVDVIHKAGGKAFIAHPYFIKKNNMLKALCVMPFDGIEVFYARFPKNETEKWHKLALEKNWLMSGGSDYHGEWKTLNQLGSSWIDEETFHNIFQKPIR